MNITSIEIDPWALPLRAPFQIATRTAAHEAQNVLVTVTASDGTQGWGASAPVQYVTGETPDSVVEALRGVSPALIGQEIDRMSVWRFIVSDALGLMPAARAGLEMALLDLWGKRWGLPLWQHFGGALTDLATDLTIPLVLPAEATQLVCAAQAAGYDCFKIKVGSADGPDADLARVQAVANAAPRAEIRIDANQAFSPDAAVAFVRNLAAMTDRISLIEQPVPASDLAGLAYVHDRIPFPLYADESARNPDEVRALLQANCIDGINVKLMKSGIFGALDIIALCRAAGVRLMVGCMLESPLGIAAAASIARGTGAFERIDLDSHRLLKDVPSIQGFGEDGPKITIDDAQPGWGVRLKMI